MAARKAIITTWGNKDLNIEENKIGLSGSPTQVVRIFTPPPKPGGKIFEGEPEETVEKLVKEMKDLL